MDRSKNLFIYKRKDITSDVESCEFNQTTEQYRIKFKNGNIYTYNKSSLIWVKNPEMKNPDDICIKYSGSKLCSIQNISVFHTKDKDYWYLRFLNGFENIYSSDDLIITYTCLDEAKAKNCLKYLQQLASANELISNDGATMLKNEYDKIKFVGNDTALAIYLNPQKHKIHTYIAKDIIFPFGVNSSQFKAVTNALSNQISIIQGPPGTGKTQTILNIIANLLIMDKTMQIVSNNNSAIMNILEKLGESPYNLNFLAALLGNSRNKRIFEDNQSKTYPQITDWEMNTGSQIDLLSKINKLTRELSSEFSDQERLAQARIELDKVNLQFKYLKLYQSEKNLTVPVISPHRYPGIKRIMQLRMEFCELADKKLAAILIFNIKIIIFFGISIWRLYKNNFLTLENIMHDLFYHLRQSELKQEVANLEIKLKTTDAKGKMDELVDLSTKYLHAKLFERFGKKCNRKNFTMDKLYYQAREFIKEYPIILSTAFSSRNNLNNITYDYLIMDEASQVDIATGALALSCAKNAIIVGDLMQLPNIVKKDMKKRCDDIFNSYNLPRGYLFSENSFLKSVCSIIVDSPQTLLREHYRCHPKIIGFCNQRFYNNELIIMTEDHGEPDVLKVYKTPPGRHKRDRINQRQIDIIKSIKLPNGTKDVGYIAPYREQVENIKEQEQKDYIEVATIHSFQGREKEIIALSTVDDVVTDFSDNQFLLNVAISRAKKWFWLLVSDSEQPKDSNIGALISYIKYNNFEIVNSKIYSVFDLMNSEYTEARMAYLNKYPHKSKYISEKLMYAQIMEILERYPNLSLKVNTNQSLNMLIRDTSLMNEEERLFTMKQATHIDFLLTNKFDNIPILAVEVDGFHFHKKGTKQFERDKLKDHILELYGIPLLRFPTNGSGEDVKIERFLTEYARTR